MELLMKFYFSQTHMNINLCTFTSHFWSVSVGMNANGIAVPMTSNGSGSVAVAIAPMNDNGHLMYRSDKADFSQRRRYSAADHIYDEIIYPACNNEQTSKS